jgi:hypothetical protein
VASFESKQFDQIVTAGLRLLETYTRVEASYGDQDRRHDVLWWQTEFERLHGVFGQNSAVEGASIQALVCDTFSNIPESILAKFPVLIFVEVLMMN